MIIVMLGAPATGKGTVAGILSQELEIPQISTGDIFRKNIKDRTELGILAESYTSKGNLVPDEVTINMVKEAGIDIAVAGSSIISAKDFKLAIKELK